MAVHFRLVILACEFSTKVLLLSNTNDVFIGFMKNLKVHENRRQLFSSSATKESTNPFVRQRPLAARSAASSSSASPPPWVNGSASSSQLFPK